MSDMSLPRLQHVVASGVIMAVGAWVTWVSFTQEPAAAFLFPRLIASVFLVLSVWTFAKACLGWTKVGAGLTPTLYANLLPGLLVMLVYVFWAAKGLGFYTATTITVFLVLVLYDPAPHGAISTWIKRIVITACFMAVMYGLFAVVLKVYTPREIFF